MKDIKITRTELLKQRHTDITYSLFFPCFFLSFPFFFFFSFFPQQTGTVSSHRRKVTLQESEQRPAHPNNKPPNAKCPSTPAQKGTGDHAVSRVDTELHRQSPAYLSQTLNFVVSAQSWLPSDNEAYVRPVCRR